MVPSRLSSGVNGDYMLFRRKGDCMTVEVEMVWWKDLSLRVT